VTKHRFSAWTGSRQLGWNGLECTCSWKAAAPLAGGIDRTGLLQLLDQHIHLSELMTARERWTYRGRTVPPNGLWYHTWELTAHPGPGHIIGNVCFWQVDRYRQATTRSSK
jgi:hypothetical protein